MWHSWPVNATRNAWDKAANINERGRVLADAGQWDAALAAYREAVVLAPAFEPAWFNMGLVHKRRRQWDEAMACNQRAASLGGEQGDPAWWNLGIAATALRRWDVARPAWQRFGVPVPDGDGEVRTNFGPAPVRLDPERNGEVVWGQRIDPARIIVQNVPSPESGHRWGDVVLHDGAPNGERKVGGQVFSVFDEIERWEASAIPTLEVVISVATGQDSEALTDIFHEAGFAAQDWSSSVRLLCRQCSEGRPFGDHDHPPQTPGRDRRFGLAAPEADAARLLQQWSTAGSHGGRNYSAPIAVG
jgi:TPR repeat